MIYSIPPVVSKGYEEKGKYITLNGMKTCKCLVLRETYIFLWTSLSPPLSFNLHIDSVVTDVTGPEDATEAICVIFGN